MRVFFFDFIFEFNYRVAVYVLLKVAFEKWLLSAWFLESFGSNIVLGEILCKATDANGSSTVVNYSEL